jgi:hypothetical protein
LIMSSLTLQPNLFHEFHPIGGVSAKPEEGDVFSWANAAETKKTMNRQATTREGLVFMRMLYQNYVWHG